MPLLTDRTYFQYNDFYAYNTCNIFTGNGFFTMLLCFLGITKVSSLISILMSFSISTLKDMIFIFIGMKYLHNKALTVFVILLASHPYLCLYSGKLTTDLFATLAVAILYLRMHSAKTNIFYDIGAIILTGFRNSLFLLYFIFYAFEIACKFLQIYANGYRNFLLSSIRNVIVITLMLLVCSLSFTAGYENGPNYLVDTFQQTFVLPLGFDYFYKIFINNFPEYNIIYNLISICLTVIVTPLVHSLFLLGAREAAFLQFPKFFTFETTESTITVCFFIYFLVIHSVGLVSFLFYFWKRNKIFLLPLLTLLPSLYLVAHLRYFMPFIPLALLGICLIINKKY